MPGYRRLEAAGEMGTLLVRAARAAVTPPYSWGGELLEQCSITARRCVSPLTLSIFFFAVGGVVTIIAGVLVILGTVDRTGAGNIVGWPRETGYWVTAMMFAGVVCCAKGLSSKGGAEGVGRAVNQAVFITFLGIWVLNCLWNAAFLPNFPDVTVLRG